MLKAHSVLSTLFFVALFCAVGCVKSDDTGEPEDTQETQQDTDTIACPPVLGDADVHDEEYPGKGWLVEVIVPFTERSCDITEGSLYLEVDDGTGTTRTEGPFSIGFDDEDVYVQDYVDGAGELFLAFNNGDPHSAFEIELWIEFEDGSSTDRLAISRG